MAGLITDSDAYDCCPGLCVIIDNIKFVDPWLKDLPNDEDILKDTFESLGFTVRVHRNLTGAEMKCTVKEYSKMMHTGAFFLIISSHGGEGDVVYGTDGEFVGIYEFEKHFYATKCPSLAGKPKVFVIDASRGMEKERIHCFNAKSKYESFATSTSFTNSANGTIEKITPETELMNVFNSADIMTIFASTRGNIAGYLENEGSIFIKMFTKVLREASTNENLTDVIKKVHRKMQHSKIQIPQLESTFSKSYFITRHRDNHKLSV